MEPLLGFTGRAGHWKSIWKVKTSPWCCSSAAPSWRKTNKAPQDGQENSWISSSTSNTWLVTSWQLIFLSLKKFLWSFTVSIDSKMYFPCASLNLGMTRDNCRTQRKWGSLLWHSGALRSQSHSPCSQSHSQHSRVVLTPFCHQLFYLCHRTHHWAGCDSQQILFCCGDRAFSGNNYETAAGWDYG